MDCWDNIVGLHGCSGYDSDTGVYLNGSSGLPAISVKNAAMLANEESHTGIDLLIGQRQRAINEMLLAIKSKSVTYKFKNAITIINNSITDISYQSPKLELLRKSKLSQWHIHSIQVLSLIDANLNITITSGLQINTFNVALVANIKQTITINQSYNDDVIITANIPLVGDDEMPFGLSATEKCDIEPYLCQLKELFAVPLQYKWAMCILENLAQNTRWNSYIAVATEDKGELFKMYQDRYEVYLKSALDSIDFKTDCCIECKQIRREFI